MLASYGPGAKITLDEISKIVGFAGKPAGLDGSDVEAMVNAGQIGEVGRYCESDVLNTFRMWLLHELFRGAITPGRLDWSELQLSEFVTARKGANPLLSVAITK